MSYALTNEYKTVTVLLGSCDYSGYLANNVYVDLNVDHDEISSSGTGTTTLTVGTGHYLLSGQISATTSNPSTGEFSFQWEVDSSLIGSQGGRQVNGKVGSDAAECVFSVLSGTKTIKLKVTNVADNNTVLPGYSQIYIRRVDL